MLVVVKLKDSINQRRECVQAEDALVIETWIANGKKKEDKPQKLLKFKTSSAYWNP